MAKHCTSASVLLTRLIGTEEDTAFALDEPELDEKNLHDLYDLMWEEEEEEPQEEKKVEVKRVSLDEMLKASASPSECSICFCEFDDMVAGSHSLLPSTPLTPSNSSASHRH